MLQKYEFSEKAFDGFYHISDISNYKLEFKLCQNYMSRYKLFTFKIK